LPFTNLTKPEGDRRAKRVPDCVPEIINI
jgi:hypothetical protein